MEVKRQKAPLFFQSENEVGPINITSAANSRFKLWKSLLGSRGIKRSGLTLVSGSKIVPEILRLRPEIIQGYISFSRAKEPFANIPSGIPLYRLRKALFRELDIHGTGYPLLLVKIPDIPAFEYGSKDNAVSLLIPFQDPGNVGAVIRSAAAFGIDHIVLLSEAALPFHPKSIRAGGTAVFLVSYVHGPSIQELESLHLPIVALSSDGVSVERFAFPERFALLPGLEGPGMPCNVMADYTVSIPMEPCVESLNAAVAVSIFLYEHRRRGIN